MSSNEVYLRVADINPYHGKPAKDWSERAALGVLANLLDRRGIKHELAQIEGDEDITNEIVESLAEIIRLAHSAGANNE